MATPEDVLSGRARWCVVHGDCLQVLPTLPEKSVDHTITDPPYSEGLYERYRTNGGRADLVSPNFGAQAAAMKARMIGSIDSMLVEVAGEISRVTRRWSVVFHDIEIAERWREALGTERYIRTGLWVKDNPMPQISGDRPGVGYEAATIGHPPGRKRWNGGGLPAVWRHPNENSQSSERAAMDHPCPKPLALMMQLVELFTDHDEVVLDPFAGSGTTGVACLRLGRRAILIEKSEKYAALARERMEAEEKGLTLQDARAGQLPLLPMPKSEKPDPFLFGK